MPSKTQTSEHGDARLCERPQTPFHAEPLHTETAWFARSEGVAVDACSNIYMSDALMGAVRAFDSLGRELDPDGLQLVDYGTGPGQLREPCDVMVSGGKLYVADTNNGAVEVYTVACTGPSASVAYAGPEAPRDGVGRAAKEGRVRIADRSDGSYPHPYP